MCCVWGVCEKKRTIGLVVVLYFSHNVAARGLCGRVLDWQKGDVKVECPKCKSNNIQAVNEVTLKKHRGCIASTIMIPIFVITFLFAWILWIISLIFGRKKTIATNKTKFVCLGCGHEWYKQ